MSIAVFLIILGLAGLVASLFLVYNPLNKHSLSMNAVTGEAQEHGQGLSTKSPLNLLQGQAINMQAEIVVSSGGIMVMSWDDFVKQKAYERITPRAYETEDGIVGDVDKGVEEVAGYLTPVPGHVGPMTIAMLLENTLRAARLRRAHAGERVRPDCDGRARGRAPLRRRERVLFPFRAPDVADRLRLS